MYLEFSQRSIYAKHLVEATIDQTQLLLHDKNDCIKFHITINFFLLFKIHVLYEKKQPRILTIKPDEGKMFFTRFELSSFLLRYI